MPTPPPDQSALSVTQLLAPLAEVDDRCVGAVDGEATSWRNHIAGAADLAALLRSRLDADGPPHIGVVLGNTTLFSRLLVAAGLSGIVPVGLNPIRRGAALRRDIAHADCQLVLTDTDPLTYGADAFPENVAALDVTSPEWTAELAGFRGSPVRFPDRSPDDLFMLIFTSGTSGEPKAVRCTHEKVAAPGVMLASRLELTADDVFYLSMPLFHSNAVMAGWAPAVAARGSIVLRRKFSASAFIDNVRRFGATYANYVGKPMSYILATPERDDDADNPLRIMYGNEAAPRDVERFMHRFRTLVIDGFGSSEGGIAIARTPETPTGSLGPLPEGMAILDVESGQPCPTGVVGELVNLSGPGLFRGYYKDPDAERERMAGGIYRSGDLGYCDEGGFVYFAGRLGDWMRVDGENLGTAPIERVLMRYPGVIEAAVYGIPDPDVGDRVMAALFLTDEARAKPFDVQGFRAFLAAQPDLGPKQWPSFVRVADALPRTETFKVIKRELAAQGCDCDDEVFAVSR